EAAKRHNDVFIFPYVGLSGLPPGIYGGVNVLMIDMKFLPMVYLDATLEFPNFKYVDFDGKAGITFGALKNVEQRVIVNSYSAGYNVTVSEYIPVYIPSYYSWHVHGMVQKEQMPSFLDTSMGGIGLPNSASYSNKDNGTLFYGAGIGFYYAADYKVTVDKGSTYHQKFDYAGYSNLNLNLLYAPTGLYQGLAASMDITSHYKVFSWKIEFLYSFADGSGAKVQLSMLDAMRIKMAFGAHWGTRTKKDPVFNLNCTVTGRTMEECEGK
ncbi:MAG: hypothetical protein OEV66_02340, partial [Spirochaetia bacterium]|nr:hypothetical protein [Spirochaetia bacterium]